MSRIIRIADGIWVNMNKIAMVTINEYKGEFKTILYTSMNHPLIEIYSKTKEEATQNVISIMSKTDDKN
jgi:hypothetical protein